jgi:hypothetical protein
VRIRRVLLLVALAGGCALPVAAPAPAPREAASASPRAAVALRRLLAAEESAPTAAELRAAGADGTSLIALARDEAVQPLVRTRAIAALRHFHSAESAAFLTELSTTAATRYARRLAARTLAAPALQP